MTIEIFDQIFSRLRLRELGFKSPTLPHDSSAYELDIEDSFLEVQDDIEFMPTPKPNPDSEAE
jgi:hypothetical protein